MKDLKDFDLNANINENEGPDMKPYSVTTYTPTSYPCLITEIITVLSAASTQFTTNPGFTESEC